ncbi:hypothetical protein GCK32_002230 [Trichostrongylus colubriformis]|uniref:Uncharacterized protein n=1 Tax=Trichostrongylus colubriformis TaxID=6319 RepID=A0AAN8J3K1_TRICO
MALWFNVLLLLLASSEVRFQKLLNTGSNSGESLCRLVKDNDTISDWFKGNEIGPVTMFYHESDPTLIDVACLLRHIVPHARHVPLRVDGFKICMQLILHPAKPGELHVLLMHVKQIAPFCTTQVYGSLPTLIEVRRTVLAGSPHGDFFTFQIIGNGGTLAFDVENNKDNVTVKNMMLAFKMLISVYISGRPWQNGFPTFSRIKSMVSNTILSGYKKGFIQEQIIHGTFPLRVLFIIRFIPIMIYASVIAFLLVVPFKRREIRVDNVMLENFEEVGREEEAPSNFSVLPTKRTTSKSPPQENTQSAVDVHTTHKHVSPYVKEERTATETEPLLQTFPDTGLESFLLPVKEEDTQLSRKSKGTRETKRSTKRSHRRKKGMDEPKHSKTPQSKPSSGTYSK